MEKVGAKIVVIGGGTGSFTLLSGLKNYTKHITALVNMADDGGSTGVLRDELGALPPGDVRQCLVALSDSEKVRDLFNYRFTDGSLKGHAFGNLFLTALEKMTGNFAEGVELASDVLRVEGRVVPVTLDDVRLVMEWSDKRITLRGEGNIYTGSFEHSPREATLKLEPEATLNPDAIAAIESADIVVIAPGGLYTSLGPILVVPGIADALATTKAKVVYACNLVNKKGHTDGFSVTDYTDEIERIAGQPILDYVLFNNSKPSQSLQEKYDQAGEFMIEADGAEIGKRHYHARGGDFLASTGIKNGDEDELAAHRSFIRHDSDKVARQIMRIYFS